MPTKILSKVMCPVHTGVTLLLCSSLIITMWLFKFPLGTPIYGFVKFNTAIGLFLLSACLVNAAKFQKLRYLFLAIKIIVILYSLAALFSDYFYLDLGIEKKINGGRFEIQGQNKKSVILPPVTALLFIAISLGMIGVLYFKKFTSSFQYLFHFVTFISFVIIIGFLFKIPALYSLYFESFTSFYTSLFFFFLSIGASLLSPSTGLTAVFTIHNTGNIVARRLFLQMMVAIIIITYIRFEIQQYNVIDSDFSIGLIVIIFVLTSMFFTLKASKSINNAELHRTIAEERFKLVVESAPNALIMTDSSGHITLINARGEDLFGYTRDELIGQKIDVLVPQKFRVHHPKNRDSYHAAPTSRYFGAGAELFAVNKDGVEFPVEIGLNPIKDGNKTAVLASVIDITERKKQEVQIKQQVIELKVKNQEMEQFNYIASHDLQEPLRTVSNYIMLLKEDYTDQLDEEVNMHLDMMESAISRMSMLVRHLLDFGRLGRDKKLTLTDCNLCVSDVVSDLNNLITQNEATVIIENSLPNINVYELELRQLFQNLINNAIKFRSKELRPEIKIGCNQSNEGFEFYVADNGLGIDKKYAKRIFQIFQRLHSSDEIEGHGIGLANCKKIVEIHGGNIWVEPNLNQGSIFKFTISKL